MATFYAGQTDYIDKLNTLATAAELAGVTGVASSVAASAAAAAASYDAFDDRYLGSKAANPTLDNDGAALLTGAIYWNTATPEMRVWTGSAWVAVQSTSAATTATTQATNASNSATAAAGSATTASTQATNASNSATAAAGSATSAANSLTSVNLIFDTFDDRFLGSKASAPTLDNDGNALVAGTVYYNSVNKTVNFYNGVSWEAPAASATASATAAAGSATTASTQATNASNSATAAAGSATTASTQATNAGTSATNAAASYDAFDDRYLGSKATNPTLDNDGAALLTGAIYWNTATPEMRVWTGSAWVAVQSTSAATTATTQATNAAGSATAAAGSATTASTQATNAGTSATNAAGSATTASTQATNASNSATAAAGSATTASTQATNASNSATAAAGSATTASTQATNAGTSATNAAASYDAFDDRYLGSKATNPTLDNDGAALLTGAIYWNTATPEMRVWTGSAWVAVQSTSSATSAATSATLAQSWATQLVTPVSGGEYSAKYWAQQAAASITGQLVYRGSWSAATAAYPSTPATGDYYKVSVAGTTNSIAYAVNDSIIYNGTGWDKIDSTDAVSSVAGQIGVVVLAKSDVGLGSVDNTSDANKPISTATSTALSGKQASLGYTPVQQGTGTNQLNNTLKMGWGSGAYLNKLALTIDATDFGFTWPISITGNAATATTVTTNANLTGAVTSAGNAASLGSFTMAQLNAAVSDADVAPVNNASFTGTLSLPVDTTIRKQNTTGEGGQFFLEKSDTSTLAGNVAIDLVGNNFRIFENGGTSKGVILDLNAQAAGASSKIITSANLASGVEAFLAIPTSANLLAAVTNETGSGNLVFATSPTLVTPVLGVATATSLSTTGDIASGGAIRGNQGIRASNFVQPMYQANVDFSADVAGTWRKLLTVSFLDTTYAAAAFKIDVVDSNANFGSSASIAPDLETYYVSCSRADALTLNSPDNCNVRGPGNRIRAVKVSAGNYEVQIQNETQYREYLVTAQCYAHNENHTVNFDAGQVAGSAGIATYVASIGLGNTWFEKLTATNQIVSTVATGTPPMVVASTTLVDKLNADLLDGQHGSYYAPTASPTLTGTVTLPSNGGSFSIETGTGDGASTTVYNTTIKSWWGIGFRDYLNATTVKAYIDCRAGVYAGQQFKALATTGTAPFDVVSITRVPNLNADLLDGNEGTFYQNASNLNAGSFSASVVPGTLYSTSSTVGSYFGNGLYYNTSWKHIGVGSYGYVLRNSGATGAQLYVASTAGTVDSPPTYATYTFSGDGNLTLTNFLNCSYVNMSHTAAIRNTDTVFYSSIDNFVYKNTAAGFKTSLGLQNVTNESKGTMFASPYFSGRVNVLASGAALPASTTIAAAVGATSGLEIHSQGTGVTSGAAFMTFHRPNSYAAHFGLDTDNVWKVGGWSMGAVAYKLWHEGNDGASSGLDADLLDGLDSTAFARFSNTHTTSNPDTAMDGFTSGDANIDGTLRGWHWLTSKNSRGSGYAVQLAVSDTSPGFIKYRVRADSASTWGVWGNVWTSGNDGTGSGLDADMLDGYHVGTSGSAIPLLNSANTWSNNQSITGSSGSAMLTISNAGVGVGIQTDDLTATSTITTPSIRATSGFFVGADTDVYLYESATNALSVRTGAVGAEKYFTFNANGNLSITGGTLTVSSTALVTSLNADLLDGLDSTAFSLKEIPQNSQSVAYTTVLADSGKHILHPSADTTVRIFTIPANASVAYPIGTAITFVNQNGAGVVTIAITTDVMRLAGQGTTGSRTLAANGIATALKLTATEWIISGTGLT